MIYDSEKQLLFSFLQHINYNQTWEQVEDDMSYNFGDYHFQNSETPKKIRTIAKQIHAELNYYFNDEGN